MAKTTVFHLIILDESGSMDHLKPQTVAGCNETLNVIRSLQSKHGDTQRNLVSIYLFQSDSEIPSRYLYKNVEIDKVKNLTEGDYKPWGCTPLLDAVGSTLVDLRAVASTHEDAVANVTIITDGYENSSTDYDWHKVHRLIMQLKELGWTFNFIGANIDVEDVSKKLCIDNAMSFKATEQGTADMFNHYKHCVEASEEERIAFENVAPSMCKEERINFRKAQAGKFFKR